MVDTIAAPDDETVVFKLKFATLTFLPALADPYAYIYSKKKPRQGHALVREEHHGLRPVQVRPNYQIGQSIKGERNPDYYHPGQPYLDGFVAHLRAQAVGARRRDPRRPRRAGIPRRCRRRRATSW